MSRQEVSCRLPYEAGRGKIRAVKTSVFGLRSGFGRRKKGRIKEVRYIFWVFLSVLELIQG